VTLAVLAYSEPDTMKFASKTPALTLACALSISSTWPTIALAEEPAQDYPEDQIIGPVHPDTPEDAQADQVEQAFYTAPTRNPRLPAKLTEVKETEDIQLLVKQGRLLQLPRAAAKVLVADPKVASFQMPSSSSVFLFAEGAGTTTLYALDHNDDVIAAIRLVARHDLAALSEQINNEIPGAHVEFGPSSGNGLIVRGQVRTPQQAKQVISSVQAYLGSSDDKNGGQGGGGAGGEVPPPRVINQLKVELSAQVNISVRIVEVSRSLSSQLGMNWEATLKNNNYFFSNASSLFTATNSGITPLRTATNAVAGGSHTRGSTSVAGLLTALSEDGLATVLAEPNLTAMSGETAGFAAGGEVPIVIITNNNVSIEYKQYGVIMRMTPTLLSPNRISLHVAPEVSDLSDEGAVTLEGNVIPAFKVRRADTTVELASGQSFALAGMLRSNINQSVTGVPGLKNIPGLGRLFETEKSDQQDTELVIIATAYVVEPTSPGDLQTPGRGIRALDTQLPSQASAGYLY